MNILYTCDNNYVWLMGVSVISLFENNKCMDNLTVYLLGNKISLENKSRLNNIAKKYKREIILIDIPDFDIPKSLLSSRWPISAFTRLYSGVLLPSELDSILYLDCDTVVESSITELSTMKNDCVILGVKDCVGKRYKENIGLEGDGIYINAGVLLINLKELRKLNINEMIDSYLNKYEKFINYADQDILNGVFKNKIGILKPNYNVMTIDAVYTYNDINVLRHPTNYYNEQEFNFAISNSSIIHFTTNMCIVRPWYLNTNHPFADKFRKYLEISPWRNKKLEYQDFNNKEYKVIKFVQMLPAWISNRILGLIHSELRPLYIKIKFSRGGRNNE